MAARQFSTSQVTVGQTWNDKGHRMPEAYGAVGNGQANGDLERQAVQAAIMQLDADGGGDLVLSGRYHLGSVKVTNDNNGLNPDSQLYIPWKAYNDSGRSHIRIVGKVKPNYTPAGLNEDFIPPTVGSQLISTATSGAVIGAAHNPSNAAAYSFNYVSVKDLMVLTPNGGAVGGIRGTRMASLQCDNVVVSINASMLNSINPSASNESGIKTTQTGGETFVRLKDCFTVGYNYGIMAGEHCVLDQVQAFACTYGINFYQTYGGGHPIYAGRIASYWCKYGLGFWSGPVRVQIEQLSLEYRMGTGKWFDSSTSIVDPNNYGYGHIVYSIGKANFFSGPDNSLFSKTGGANLTCISIDDL